MPRRKHYSRHKFKIKLKKNTVYSIFAFVVILAGLLCGLSFTRGGNSFITLNDYLKTYFGITAILFPILLVLIGFFFLKLKFFLSKPNVTIGALIFFICLLGLSSEGIIGLKLHELLANILTGIGAFFVYLAGIFVGLIVLFDTSIDELVTIIGSIMEIVQKLIPGKALNFFKKKQSPLAANKMVIKGMQDREMSPRDVKINTPAPVATTKRRDRLFPISWL